MIGCGHKIRLNLVAWNRQSTSLFDISSTVKPSKLCSIEGGGAKISSSEVGGRKGDMFLIDI